MVRQARTDQLEVKVHRVLLAYEVFQVHKAKLEKWDLPDHPDPAAKTAHKDRKVPKALLAHLDKMERKETLE